MKLFEELILPNGIKIPNRIAKAAMEENLADFEHNPSDELFKLYDIWAKGEIGLIITGNVMIDSKAMTGPAGVVLESDKNILNFKKWAKIIKSNGAIALMQINHPGRQMPKNLGQKTIAPSSVALNVGIASKAFAQPKEMTEHEIHDVINRFVNSALLAEKSGFDGIEIHAAHGYLISQFLSSNVNKREDRWGGSIENRAKILVDIISLIKQRVSKKFIIAVKLNSADFQKGGFTSEDAIKVIELLNALKVDLLEISGGSYEEPTMMGKARDSNSLDREAYFLKFADEITTIAKMPVMVTGGIRKREIANEVLETNVDMVGIGTTLSLNPNLVNEWRNNSEIKTPKLKPITWSNKTLASLANMAMVKYQFNRIVKGKTPDINVSPLKAFLIDRYCNYKKTKEYRKWIKTK